MGRAEEYRSYAAKCLALAQRAQDPNDRARLLDMANALNRLAGKAEGQSGSDDDPAKA